MENIALVVVTFFLVVVAVINLLITRKSVAAMERSSAASESMAEVLAKDFQFRMRPWVCCVDMQPDDWSDLHDWKIDLKNVGAVPADKVVTYIQVEVDGYKPCAGSLLPHSLFPQQTMRFTERFRNSAMDSALRPTPRTIRFEINIKYIFAEKKYENMQYFVSYVREQECYECFPDSVI